MKKKTNRKFLSIFLMSAIIMLNSIIVTKVKADETYNLDSSWGTRGTENGQFLGIGGITTDRLGNIYICPQDTNYKDHRIQKFDSRGNYISQFNASNASTIAVDALGNIYIAYGTYVQKFDSKGNVINGWSINVGIGESVKNNFIIKLVLDKLGNVYVATQCDLIMKFDSNGKYIDGLGTANKIGRAAGEFYLIDDIAVDEIGNLYVSEYGNNRIQKFDLNLNYITQWDASVGKGTIEFEIPQQINVDVTGNIYAAYGKSKLVKKFDCNGNYITQWKINWKNNEENKRNIFHIDRLGNIYILECDDDYYYPDCIKKFNLISNKLMINETIMINNGANSDLKRYLTPNNKQLTWKSSDENIVKVNNGVITAVSTGTAKINILDQNGIEYGIFTVNVTSNNISTNDIKTIRLGGKDRYETAVIISQAGWKDTSKYAVLASGKDFPDALSAAPLAKKFNSPILLTDKNSLPSYVINELKRLQVSHIFMIGGLGSISQEVENQISNMGISIERLGGKDRYETAIKIADKLGIVSGEFIVTNGYQFADALSASSISAKKGMPILLTDKNNLPNSVLNFLEKTSFSKAYVLGDKDIVSDSVVSKLQNYERIVGKNKYERNINIIKKFEKDIDFRNICIAAGKDFPDALTGSALATAVSSAIVLVDDNDIEDITKMYTSEKKLQVNNVYVFGLEGSLKDETINTILNKK